MDILYESSKTIPHLFKSDLKKKASKTNCKAAIKQAFASTFPETTGSSKKMVAADFLKETDQLLEVYNKQHLVKISLTKKLEPNAYEESAQQEPNITPCTYMAYYPLE